MGVAMAAGLKNLQIISTAGFFAELETKTDLLVDGILAAAAEQGVAMRANRAGAMFGLFFTEQDEITRFSQVSQCDVERFVQFFHGMLKRGVNLAPSAFEAGFVSAAHSAADIEQTIEAATQAFAEMAAN